MPSHDELVAKIRERIDYAALFAEFLQLRGQGAERKAFCVFHENTDTEAMAVNVVDGLYYCHNPSCGARGDVFDFYRRMRSLTFPEAVDELARRVGLDPNGVWADAAVARNGHHAPAGHALDSEAVLAAHLAARESGQPVPTAAAGRLSALLDEPESGRSARRGVVSERKVIDEVVFETYSGRLWATPSQLDYLRTTRGLTDETIRSYEIGHDEQRYTLPVRDTDGACVNIRRYDPDARQSHFKMISWRSGFGEARLYPLDRIEATGAIYLVEGEWDALVARQHGLNALTVTTGAGTWRDSFNRYFVGREVVICYDVDDAGRKGAANVARELHGVASSVKVVALPLSQDGADISDYFVRHGHTRDDFLAIVGQTAEYAPSTSDALAITSREPVSLHLSEASEAQHYNQPIRINVMVSGKTTAPYLVPQDVKMSCRMPGLKMCERCPVAKKAGSLTHSIEFATNEVLQFINVSDGELNKKIKTKVGIPSKCTYVNQDVIKAMNIEEIQIIPEIERGSEKAAAYVTRASFYLGHGLTPNQSYIMTGVTVPAPRNQMATHLIYDAVPSQSNIDAFRATEYVTEQLKVFQPSRPGVDGLWEQLEHMYNDLEGVTRIYQRQDLMLAVDLTFHSVLGWHLQGERVKRGWCECLIVGDSRTGKSTVVERLVGHYGAGELTTGENTSFAGLVGGLHQIGNSWALQWGRWPLNDRRLLVIDEAGNLGTDQIGRMSSMRSSGVAEVIKVHTERTTARTRTIWISNPRGNKPLSAYSQGVLAIKELIGAPEDIARFDIVLTAASSDVPLGVVNASRGQHPPQVFTSELCHQRVMWAWSRTSEHVEFSEGATEKVLEVAMRHGNTYRYGTEIPLVEPNEQRIKLARLAVAAAVMFYSTDDTGQHVVVKPEHVEFVGQFLDIIYNKPSLAFTEYADNMKRRYEITADVDIERIMRRNDGAVRAMLEQEAFTLRDLQEILGFDDRTELREAAWTMRNVGFLRKGSNNNYVKTPAAIRWLRQEIQTRGGEIPSGDGFAHRSARVPSHQGRGMPVEHDDPGTAPEW